jgi:surfeit locus 1 family protein
MTTSRAGRRSRGGRLIVPGLLTLVGLVVLICLGTWQLERKAWKDALVAALAERLSAPPQRLPARETWARLSANDTEFRRVTFPAEYLHEQEARVYSAGSALRPDVSGPGYWIFTPARLPGGSVVVVNRGFVPEGRQDQQTRAQGQVGGIIDIVGAMRWPEQRSAFSAKDDPANSLWFVRDHLAMAEAKGWGQVAPFYIDQETPTAPDSGPRAGPLQPRLPNNHLGYAITWYGLAAALLVIFVLWARKRLREGAGGPPTEEQRGAGDPPFIAP